MFPGFLSPTWLFLCLLALTAASPLVPFKNSPSLHARSTWKRAIVPKDVVSLHYSQLGATYASSSLTFPAHSNTPILLLEDIDFLVDSVVCSLDGSAVHISFTSDDSYAATLAAWSSLPQFMLITAHMGCNPHDQRAAWRVVGVVGADYTHKISLDVLPVPLREVGAGYKIRHNTESTTASWGAPQILRRDSEIDNITNFDYSIDFDPRQQLIPVNTNALGPSSALTDSLKDLTPPGLEVFCTNCVSITKFALGVEVQVDDLLNIEEAYVNLTVTDFQQDIQLEISFNDTTNFEKDIDVMLVRLPDLSISLHDIVDIGFYWGGAVRMGLDIAHALNFTVGASATIPTGTSATLMLSNFSHFFRLWMDSYPPPGRLYVNTPRVNAVANLSTHVNRECNPLGPNDYEFFDNALTFGAELEITIDGTTNRAFHSLTITDSDMFSQSLSFSELPPLATPSCMVVVDDHTTSSLAGEVIAANRTLPRCGVSDS
ncbi:hypothetical protein C8F01DRAFT_1232825 [Mycena amicta]|nr:hypothetical protein C8F01DRAFT_1232825 [Mycena amicta]